MTFTDRESAREGLRNIAASPVRSTVTAGIAFVLGLGTTAASITDVRQIEDRWRSEVSAGSEVVLVRPLRADQQIPAARCDAALNIGGVKAAGAVMDVADTRPSVVDKNRVPVVAATPGFLRLAWSEEPPPDAGSAAGARVTQTLGLAPGSGYTGATVDDDAPVLLRVDHTFSTDARFEMIDDAIVAAQTPTETVSECAVEAEPGTRSAVVDALTAWFYPVPVVTASLLETSRRYVDPSAELRSRWSQWVPFVTGSVLLVVCGLMAWARRSETGLYALLGMSRRGLRIQATAETLVGVWLPVCVGTLVGMLALGPVDGLVGAVLVRDVAKLWCFGLLLPLAARVGAPASRSLEFVRGR